VNSILRHETAGADGIWRGLFVGPGGYPITATLDLGATERIARIRGGVEVPVERVEKTAWEVVLAWVESWLGER
jgi:hypothetical protein